MTSEKEKGDALLADLYPRIYPMLVNYAAVKVGDRLKAEELAQDTFATACEKYTDFLSSKNPTGWLVLTLKNNVRNYLRSQALWRQLLSDASVEDSDAVSADDADPQILYAGVIPQEELQLIMSIEIDGCTYDEMSAQLGISIDACRKRVQRAEAKFRQNLELSNSGCPKTPSPKHIIKGGMNHVE